MKKKMFKLIVLCLSIWGLVNVVTCSVMVYPEARKIGMNHNTDITEEELLEFMPLRKEFVQKYADNSSVSEISMDNKKPSEVLSFKMRFWILMHNWQTDRFFYVEQRLYDLLNLIYIKRHAFDVIATLSKSLEAEKDTSTIQNMKKIIAEQIEILNSSKMNNSEMRLAEKYFEELDQMFSNKN